MVFKRPNCNGALTVDGSSRAPECTFCHASAFLPDELWHLFHPVVQKRSWSALFDEATGRKRRAQKRADARDPATPSARLLELLAENTCDLTQALVDNPGLPRRCSWRWCPGSTGAKRGTSIGPTPPTAACSS